MSELENSTFWSDLKRAIWDEKVGIAGVLVAVVALFQDPLWGWVESLARERADARFDAARVHGLNPKLIVVTLQNRGNTATTITGMHCRTEGDETLRFLISGESTGTVPPHDRGESAEVVFILQAPRKSEAGASDQARLEELPEDGLALTCKIHEGADEDAERSAEENLRFWFLHAGTASCYFLDPNELCQLPN